MGSQPYLLGFVPDLQKKRAGALEAPGHTFRWFYALPATCRVDSRRMHAAGDLLTPPERRERSFFSLESLQTPSEDQIPAPTQSQKIRKKSLKIEKITFSKLVLN